MSDFPFLYFHHGELNAETVGESEELFLWFDRVLTGPERRRIVENCPAPVAGLFAWGDRFAYFGSGGGRFDTDIMETYGTGSPGSCVEPSVAKAQAVGKFNAALQRWALMAHDIVPLAFFTGPQGAEKDAWGLWSEEQLEGAVERVVAYARARPEILALLERPLAGALESDGGTPGERCDLSEEARYFSYIYGAILRWDVQLVADPEALDLLYATDGILGPVSRPSLDESKLHRNGEAVSVYLARGGQSGLEAALGTLAPYTQLAFLASHTARRAGLLDELTDPVDHVERLVASVRASRFAVITSLVQMIADNGCQVGPTFDVPDKDRAGLGAALLALAHDREDCPPEGFVHAALYHEWTQDYGEAVAVVEHGLACHPRSLDLARAALAVANLGGLTAEAATFAELVAELGTAPDERSILDQSYALIHSDDMEGARDALLAYHKDDGDMSADVWVNLLFTVHQTGDHATTKRVVELAEVARQEDPDGLSSAALLENLAIGHVVLDQGDQALACLRRLQELAPDDFDSLRTSEPLEPLWDDPDFVALFEG
jgi:hypothetical protein